jgi:nucleotide-binding universal stress UspA family protein
MFTNVIVPLDGSREATAALPFARALGAAAGARIRLLRVVRRPAGLFAAHANEVHDAAAYLAKVVRDEFSSPGSNVSTHVGSGDVVEAILRELDDGGSDVIVMATRGHGGMVRAVLGSVASELLSRSPVPVVLLRSDSPSSETVGTILAPLDGSPESEESLVAALDVAGLTNAHVTLLRVVTPTPMPTWAADSAVGYDVAQYVDPAPDSAALADATQYVDELVQRLGMQGVSANGLARLGDVRRMITKTADAVGADLIIMRTRGHTGPARAVLGSVADAVVRSAPAPVMLLRHRTAAANSLTRQRGARRLAAPTPR